MEVKMKKLYKVLVSTLFIATTSLQGQWYQTFGGSETDYANSVQQTTDGGYIITGNTKSFGNGEYDVWLIKTDSNGDSLWTHTFGGGSDESGHSVQQTTDGGYIITGNTDSFGNGDWDVWLIKTDANGDSLWTKTFGGSDYDYGESVEQTTDGGYIITGYTKVGDWNDDVYIIKTNSNGDSLWTKIFGGSSNDRSYSVQQTTDGGYIIGGFTYSYGNGGSDFWLIKTDSNGNEEWNQTFGGSSNDDGNSVQQTTDGGYIITGRTKLDGSVPSDVWLIKTDSQGDSVWTKTFGGSSSDNGYSVQQTTDGGYIIGGFTYSYGNGGSDVWLIKIDSQGQEEWNQTFGGSSGDGGDYVKQTEDGGYIIAGYTSSLGNGGLDVWLIKTDSLGYVGGLEPKIVINEIMQNPSAVNDSEGEWFEIVNTGNYSVSLENWVIKDNGSDNHTITSSLVIAPGEYKVLGINSNSNNNGGVIIDYQYSGITLSNGADEIILVDTHGVVFDSVAYDGGPVAGGTFPDPTGASMALVHPDSNNNVGTNWQESTTAYGDGDLGTPGIPNFSSDIHLELTALDFDTVFVNESGTLDLTITNNGNVQLQIDSLYTSSDLFTLSIDNSLIETSAILSITYTPVEFGPDTGTAYIKSNDPDEGFVQISLSGFGYYLSPNIELSANSINFGGVMDGLTGTQLLHVYNTGDAALELDTMYCTDNFTVAPSNGTVNIGDTLTLEVTFAPDDETSFAGTMTIVAGNDPDEDTLTVSLSGTGTQQAAIISSNQDTVLFGEVGEGQTSNQSIIIRNIGMIDLEVEEISFSGGDTSLFSTTFSDATIEAGDSVVVPILFTNQSNTQIYVETMSIISNDSYTGTLNILLVVGLNQIIFQELFYDDGTAETSIGIGEGNMIANRFMLPIPAYLSSVKYYFFGNEGGQIDIVIWDSGENNLPYNELVRINNVEVQLGWFEYDLNLNIPSGDFFVGYEEPSNAPNLGVDIDSSSPVVSYLNIEGTPPAGTNGEWVALTDVFGDAVFMIRAIVFTGPENTPPDNFSLTGPNNNAQITINDSNMVDGFITFSWDESSDANGDSLVYLMRAASAEIGNHDLDTNATSIDVSYMDIIEDMAENNVTVATLEWTVHVTDGIDTVEATNAPFTVMIDGGYAMSVYLESLLPDKFALHQNYPNPFNPITTLRYDLPENSLVNITIYDMLGRQVKTLVNQTQDAGFKSVIWDATNDFGKPVSAGVYLYQIQAGEFVQTKKMVLLK
jgi:hypothetical protein